MAPSLALALLADDADDQTKQASVDITLVILSRFHRVFFGFEKQVDCGCCCCCKIEFVNSKDFFCRSTRRWRLVPRKIWPSPAACMLRFLGSIGGVSVCPGAVDPSGEEALFLRSTACAVLLARAQRERESDREDFAAAETSGETAGDPKLSGSSSKTRQSWQHSGPNRTPENCPPREDHGTRLSCG
ncbi:hypothetical protein pipiens_002976 [Culex pipiens pipiens]|uniref:Uncharacterized protein n=1 Tax=Culex pipiens pipiens TaxID=38569 RepID=A0ABD1D5D9_CULPP